MRLEYYKVSCSSYISDSEYDYFSDGFGSIGLKRSLSAFFMIQIGTALS